jgi:hypothetical protein
VTILIRHSDGSDTRPPGEWPVAEDPALAERLARFHRRHQGETLRNWLAVIPFVVVVAWAVIVGASSLFVR